MPTNNCIDGVAGGLRAASQGSSTEWGCGVPGAMVARPEGTRPDAGSFVRGCEVACVQLLCLV